MNVAQLRILAAKRLDEDQVSPTYWTTAEFLEAFNEGQQILALMTLCLETTRTLPLTAAKPFYRLRGYFADFLVPLRVRVGGVRIRPARLDELDARNPAWQATAGTAPDRYVQLGFSFFGVTPQPTVGTTAEITYARSPVRMTADTDEPEVPAAYHEALIDYAIPHLVVKEGGGPLSQAVPHLKRFIAEGTKLADYVRARSLAGRYDRLPAELGRVDLSRLFKGLLGGDSREE